MVETIPRYDLKDSVYELGEIMRDLDCAGLQIRYAANGHALDGVFQNVVQIAKGEYTDIGSEKRSVERDHLVFSYTNLGERHIMEHDPKTEPLLVTIDAIEIDDLKSNKVVVARIQSVTGNTYMVYTTSNAYAVYWMVRLGV